MISTTGKCFVDTNILVYAFLQREDPRARIAREWLHAMKFGDAVISTQVLAEFAQVAGSKAHRSASEVERLLRLCRYADVVFLLADDIIQAVRLRGETSISLWDAMIVVAAQRAGCQTLLTEDLNHGQVVRGVRIVNPFKDASV